VKKLNIAILWHMHQPNYRDPMKGYYSMPWVRLHATKAYYDMARLAERFPGLGLTFNLVPSLLEQIEDYAAGAVDFELLLSQKDPAALTPEDKEAILSRFFQANYDTMIRPYPRYTELLQNRGRIGTYSNIKRAVQSFAAQDYLDLQVLFNLSWFGFSLFSERDELRKLVRKGRFFTIDDRELVLGIQLETIGKLMPLYKKLWDEGSVDLATSPFYHPILPLLCDTSTALEGIPGCLLPKKRFRYPEDAARQVDMGLSYMEKKLGRKPNGMWPSEGSVSPDALRILNDAGVAWAATDEGILGRSISTYSKERDLYKPWDAGGVAVFFRDIRLSDQIGFVYARNPAPVAVDDFIGRLKNIAETASGDEPLVSVILDGENAWETYPDSGKEFLSTLYNRITEEQWLKPVTFSGYLESHPPAGKIESIFPGSWINANFDTWIGDQEEADGWDALKNTREMLVEKQDGLSEEARREAWLEIFRAEGSDWFWWYGDDHSSPNDPEFDRLFRAHLQRVYQITGVNAPAEITESIIKKQMVRADVEPTGLIEPVIDGRLTTFYEWLSAGWFPAVGPEGAMSGGEPLVSDVYYGFNLENLYFRFDFVKREEQLDLAGWSLSIYVQNDSQYRIDMPLCGADSYLVYRKGREGWVRRTRKTTVAVGRVVELAVPWADLNLRTGEKVYFTVGVCQDGLERERLPRSGAVSFIVPDHDFAARMWQL
jgi:alpha-amylase/alpha-mannosidase (GH57 family)